MFVVRGNVLHARERWSMGYYLGLSSLAANAETSPSRGSQSMSSLRFDFEANKIVQHAVGSRT